MNGFALGGVAEGFNQARQTGIQQQQVDQQGTFQQKSLALQQQALQNQQQRELFARADKERANLMSVATETIQALKLQGKDDVTIAKAVQPIVQAAKRLAASSGGDPTVIDAQLAATLAQPSVKIPGVTGGGSAQPQPAPTADVGGGTPMPPGQNLTAPGTTITGIDYGPTEYRNSNGQPVAAPTAQPQEIEVDKWTRTLATLPAYATPTMKAAVQARLTQAIQQSTPDAQVHFMKTEDGNEIPLVIKKQGGNVSVTDIQGNPYVVPTGEGTTDAQVIGDAIISGKQPPALTGLYKQAKSVKAYLARKGFDQTQALMEWQAAQKQVASLNGPQMVRYAGLAKSVVNTIDEILDLSKKMELSGVPLANAAKIQAYMQTAGNSEGGQLAARYLGAVTTLKEEFANLAQGGYAPTEAAFALANKQINESYGVKQMEASLTEVQRLIRYRLNGIPNFGKLGPSAPNRFTGVTGNESGGHAAPSSSAPPPPPPGFVLTSPSP